MSGSFNTFLSEVASWENQDLSVLPGSLTTTPEGTVTYEIHIYGTTDPIEGEYVTLSATATHPSITCTIAPNNQAAPFIATMTVHVSSSTPPGTYSITVVATSTWEQAGFPETVLLTVMSLITATVITPAQTTTPPTVSTPTVTTPPIITRTITPTYTITEMPDLPPFDFILQIIPSTIEVFRGDTAHYQVIIEYSAPEYYGTPIEFEVVNLIPGMNWFYNSTGIYIFTHTDAPLGTHNFQVFGSALGVTHGADGWIAVTEGLPREEEERRRVEEEEQRLREEEEQRLREEETSAIEVDETQHPRTSITDNAMALFLKLSASARLDDPKIWAGLATVAAAIIALALAKESKKLKEAFEKRQKAEDCYKFPPLLSIIITVVTMIMMILLLIWLLTS
jgi:hypothetical protein